MRGAAMVFWAASVVLGYTYIGYPGLLWLWSRLRTRPTYVRPFAPMVTVLVVAYNEADRIDARLRNLLALDYRPERLEIIVASDGSTDDTVARAQRYRSAGVTVFALTPRRGKSAVLNQLVPRARGEIVVLADARQQFDAQALRRLAAHFVDFRVGAVSGDLVLANAGPGSAAGEGIGRYWQYEKFIRRHESRIDSTVGATGAICAIRRDLFEPVPEDTLVEDVLIPLRIARRGLRVLFEPSARAYDCTASGRRELARKARTLAGNFQLFARERWLLSPFANRLWVQTISHKVCRLLSPLCLAAILGANLLLAGHQFYRWTLALQLAFYAAALCGHLLRHARARILALSLPYAFCLLNWAIVLGFIRFVTGRQRVTWETANEGEGTRFRER